VFEAVVAPLAAALAFHHARRALGGARAAGELLALVAYGFALEAVAMAVFASHVYDASWRIAPLGVPLAVAAVWAAVITSAMAVAGRREEDAPGWRAVTAALVAITLDLMIEPVAVRAGLWRWTPPGPWLDVPIGNFVGWAVIVGAYAYGAARWAGTGAVAIQAGRRIALASACILALVLVGAAWTSLALERAFAHGRGWSLWTAVLMATLWRLVGKEASGPQADREAGARAAGGGRWGGLGGQRGASLAPRRRSPPSLMTPATSLPALLARAPGRGPEAALGVVGLAFFGEAVRAGDPRVTVAAAGSLATLALVTAATLRRRAP
jgi:hypothetical protein